MKFNDFVSKESFKKAWIEYIKDYVSIKDEKYLDNLFEKYYKDTDTILYNSVKGNDIILNSRDFLANKLKDYIIVENGVFFVKHDIFTSPLVGGIQITKDGRDFNKGNMKKAKGRGDMIEANYYDNAQASNKIGMNTLYGSMLNGYSKFYNYDVASAITIRGRSTVTINGLLIEMTLGTYRPYNLEAHLFFIKRACDKNIDEFKDIIEIPSTEDVLHHLLQDHYDNYYGMDVLRKVIDELSDIDKAKVYYSCNFVGFIKNKYINNLIRKILSVQDGKFEEFKKLRDSDDKSKFGKYKSILYFDALNAPDNIKEYIKEYDKLVKNLIGGFLWFEGDTDRYGNEYLSTQEIFRNIRRKQILVNDTDSVMIGLEYNTNNIRFSIPDFKDLFPNTPKDTMDYILDSIVINTIDIFIKDTLARYTEQSEIPEKYRSIIMYKQEFVFRTIQVTKGAKNYIGKIVIQEGVYLPFEQTDIKGLSLKKSNFNKRMSKMAQHITVDMISDVSVPDIKSIMEKIKEYRDVIIKEYHSKGNIKYFTPLNLKKRYGEISEGEYRVKACRLYEALYGEPINLPGTFLVCNMKFDPEVIEENYPREFEIMNQELVRRDRERYLESLINSIGGDEVIQGFSSKQKKLFENLVNAIRSVESIKELKDKINVLKLEDTFYEDILSNVSLKVSKFSDITKIALPIDSETVPPFVTEFMDHEDLTVFENLIATTVQGLGIEVVRNKKKRSVISNIVSFY